MRVATMEWYSTEIESSAGVDGRTDRLLAVI